MCAATALIPVVVTPPLTDLSSLMVIVPLPEADVVTGGTSCSPVSLTETFSASAVPDNRNAAAEVARKPASGRMNCLCDVILETSSNEFERCLNAALRVLPVRATSGSRYDKERTEIFRL